MRRYFFKGTAVFLLCAMILATCSSEPQSQLVPFDEEAWLADVKARDISLLYAPHYNEENGTFFNPWMLRSERRRPPDGVKRRGFFMFRKRPKYPPWPEKLYQARDNDYSYLTEADHNSISFAGHASMIIKMDGETIFTDPFFSNRAAIMSKNVKIKFDYSKVPQKPVVLISHNHYDHLDKQSVKALMKKNAVFIVPLKLKSYLEKWGAREVYELDWWQSLTLDSITYTLLPAQHWSRRVARGQGSGMSLWGSFMIQGSKTIYFSGDSGYFRGFEEFGSKYEIDYAIIGVGAYEPRWFMHYSHLGPDEFILAADELGAKVSMPMHFGIISLSDEPLNYPLYVLDEFKKSNPEYEEKIKLLRVGEVLEF